MNKINVKFFVKFVNNRGEQNGVLYTKAKNSLWLEILNIGFFIYIYFSVKGDAPIDHMFLVVITGDQKVDLDF